MRTLPDGFFVTPQAAPALGDLRSAGVVFIKKGSETRKDWPRYVEAIAAAVSKGADVIWIS